MKEKKVLLLALLLLVTGNCFAQNWRRGRQYSAVGVEKIDSVCRKNIGNELADVLLLPDSMFVRSSSAVLQKPLPRSIWGIVRYSLCNTDLYRSKKKVYGMFSPFVTYVFCKGQVRLELNLDYGLHKWNLVREGKVLREYDMPADFLLPLSYQLLSDDDIIKMTYFDYINRKK